MKTELPIALLVVVVTYVPSTAVSSSLSIGAGVGAVLHEYVGTEIDSKSGVMRTLFLEYISEENVGVRGELSWIEFPNDSPDLLPETGFVADYRSVSGEGDIGLSGVSFRLLWTGDHGKWVQTIGSFSVGGYKVKQEEHSQVAALLGPAFGARFGTGRPSAGVELDMQLAVFEDKNMFMVPLRIFVVFKFL